MSGKTRIDVRSYRAVLLLAIAISGGRTVKADDCPYEYYSRPSLPALDWRITVDDASFPQLEQGESSSIALDWGEKWLVAWQGVNADLSPDNDIYCTREIDHNAPGIPNDTDCPLPLTLEGDGARHTAPSVAIGLREPSPNSHLHFLVGWTSQILASSIIQFQ